MAETTKKPCCPAKVEVLIMSKHNNLQEVDREWLSSLDEPQVNQLVAMDAALANAAKKLEEIPQLNKEQALQQLKDVLSNPDQFLSLLNPELQEQFRVGIQLHREKKQKLIQSLVQANPSRFNEANLVGRTMEALEELASMIPQPDYSVNAAGTGNFGGYGNYMNPSAEEDILLPVGSEINP